MASYARLDLTVWRNDDVWTFPLRVRGPNLTGVALHAEIQRGGDWPGPALAVLDMTTLAGSTGIRLVQASAIEDGVYVTRYVLQLAKPVRQDFPYEGEPGEPWIGKWALQIGGKTKIVGDVVAPAHAIGSDGAPADRQPGAGSGVRSPAGVAEAELLITTDGDATVTIDGTELLSSVIEPLAAAAAAVQPILDNLDEVLSIAGSIDAINEAAANAALIYAQAAGGFPTRAAGEAAVQLGQAFKVVTSAGDADVYRRTATGSVWIAKALPDDRLDATQLKLAEASVLVSPWPVTPLVDLEPTDALGYGGRVQPRRNTPVSGNLLAHNSGNIPPAAGFNGTITRRAAAGHTTGLAQRLQFGAANAIFYLLSARTLPAGDYWLQLRAKSSPAAGNQAVRFGRNTALQGATIGEGAFSLLTLKFTANGTTPYTFVIQGDGTNQPDILIDEVTLTAIGPDAGAQLKFATIDDMNNYPGDKVVGMLAYVEANGGSPYDPGNGLYSWTALPQWVRAPAQLDAGTAAPPIGLPAQWPVTGNALSPVAGGILRGPSWPAVTALPGWTVAMAFRRQGRPAAAEYLLISPADVSVPVTANDLTLAITPTGALSTKPLTAIPTSPDYATGAWHIVVMRGSPSELSVWIDGVQVQQEFGVYNPLRFDLLRIFGQTETSLRFGGQFGGLSLYGGALTDAQVVDVFRRHQQMLELRGYDTGRGELALIFEGDSRTYAFGSVTPPTSHAWRLLSTSSLTDGVQRFGGVLARSGEGINDLVRTDQPGEITSMLASIRGALAMGRVPVCVIWVGVNDHGEIDAADDATAAARAAVYWSTKYAPYLQRLKDAGARVVVMTELPGIGAAAQGGNTAWNRARLALRDIMLASPIPHAVADIGNPATALGDVNSPYTHPEWWQADKLHLNDAGQALLPAITWPAIKLAAGIA